MTHEELITLLTEKLDEAEALLGKCKNGDRISITKKICYVNDELEELAVWDPDKDSALMAELHVSSPDKRGDDAPEISFVMALEYADGTFPYDEDIQEELMAFDGEIDMFLPRLSAAEDIDEFIAKERIRQDKEAEMARMNLQKMMEKVQKYSRLALAGIIALTVILTLLFTVIFK